MGKIRIREILKSNDESIDISVIGIVNKNKIIYKENDIKVTIVVLSNKIIMNREHSNYEIDFVFEKGVTTKATYKLKEYNKEFKFDIKTTKLEIKEDLIDINYSLDNNIFRFTLKIGG